MTHRDFGINGLTDDQVRQSRERHGQNDIRGKKEIGLLVSAKALIKEPMFLLLLAASTIYFVSGKNGDGILMVLAIVLVATISLFQDTRSRNALEALKDLTAPKARVIRNGVTQEVSIEELVVDDCIVVEEGTSIPADGVILRSNDFSVNESILTGESLPVLKNEASADSEVFRGTTVAGGLALCKVVAVGNSTRLGKIGESLSTIEQEKTPLQLQIGNFVRKMALVGAFIFAVVWAINFFQSRSVLDSLLKALTLAMSILPEEIPVAFTTFMALGSWRLMKMGIIVKHAMTVETLGSATVICTDKTGTITENKMALAKLFVLSTQNVSGRDDPSGEKEIDLIRTAMWASEPIPFDPMEVALHQAYGQMHAHDERPDYALVHEYPLGGKPPMMTHIFENQNGTRIVAAKGAPEAILNVSDLPDSDRQLAMATVNAFAAEGYRVLGVAQAEFVGTNYPEKQETFTFVFKGLVSFHDPPKENIPAVLADFYRAGIAVKIITGDNLATTNTIARQIGFRGADKGLTGDELMALDDSALREKVMAVNIFSRMFPEAKLKIIEALKAQGQIVAMTGDGVNDGPALKAAHIGIAMGRKGADIARQASSLILVDDDLGRMVLAVAMGRKIYVNLKKAIQYIISIHIPIILTVFIPLALGWIYPAIFYPVHIIFLELIMGPTCSIIYENEPMEENTMTQIPRPFTATFFRLRELAFSIVQGLAITAGTLFIYTYGVHRGYDESIIRTMVFVVLVAANIFLTLVNRSFHYSFVTTARYRNNLIPVIIVVTLTLTALTLFVPQIREPFQFGLLNAMQISLAATAGFVSVIWFEVVKAWRRKRGLPSN